MGRRIDLCVERGKQLSQERLWAFGLEAVQTMKRAQKEYLFCVHVIEVGARACLLYQLRSVLLIPGQSQFAVTGCKVHNLYLFVAQLHFYNENTKSHLISHLLIAAKSSELRPSGTSACQVSVVVGCAPVRRYQAGNCAARAGDSYIRRKAEHCRALSKSWAPNC